MARPDAPRPRALDGAELDAAVGSMDGWSIVDGKLHAEFSFADFSAAFGFMAAAAVVAAELDHHPEWTNVYSRVTVDLVTHDVAGITDLDLTLARRMSAIASGLPERP